MCPDCKGLGKRITTDINLLLNKEKSIREGAINHPDYKVGGWNWREMVGVELLLKDSEIKKLARRRRKGRFGSITKEREKLLRAGETEKAVAIVKKMMDECGRLEILCLKLDVDKLILNQRKETSVS